MLHGHAEGTVIEVLVVPNASRDEIVGVHGDVLRVRTSAPPEKGKANDRVVDILGTALQTRVRLLSGGSSRRKRFLAAGVDREYVRNRLGL